MRYIILAGDIDILRIGAEDAARVRRSDDPLHPEWVSTTSMCTSLLLFDQSLWLIAIADHACGVTPKAQLPLLP